MPEPAGPMPIASSLSSVNARLFAFARQLKGRGHQVLIAGPDELDQVCLYPGPDVITTESPDPSPEADPGPGLLAPLDTA